MGRGSLLHRLRRLGGRLRRPPPETFPPRPVRLDYAGAEIFLIVSTSRELRSRVRSCAKEPWTVAWIEENVGEGEVLYDVGANVGAYTLVAAKVAPGARVVAFEPGYASFAALCENVRVNGVADRVTPLPVVLGSQTRLDTLGYREVAAGAAEHALGSPGAVHTQPVLSYRLDDLVAEFDLSAPTLVKLDVDGAEASVLEGGARTFSSGTVRSVIVEIERSRETDVVGLLGQYGLELRSRIDERDGVRLPYVWYGVFAR